jgi:hypothetical protein
LLLNKSSSKDSKKKGDIIRLIGKFIE